MAHHGLEIEAGSERVLPGNLGMAWAVGNPGRHCGLRIADATTELRKYRCAIRTPQSATSPAHVGKFPTCNRATAPWQWDTVPMIASTGVAAARRASSASAARTVATSIIPTPYARWVQ